MKLRVCFVIVTFLSAMVCTILAQTTASKPTPPSTQVPRLIKFSGVARDESGKSITGVVGVTFSLYKDQQAGTLLWMETQNVQADATGRYTALLGSASADGVPLDLFSAGEAQWLGVQIQGQPERPRVLLVSVPYAIKAHEAETLGGMPASAFVLANPGAMAASGATNAIIQSSVSPHAPSKSAATVPPPATITGSGTTDFIPLWTSSTNLGNSGLFQTGGNIGLGTKTPAAKLDSVTTGIGLRGTTSGGVAVGVVGLATATSTVTYGVLGTSASATNGSAGVNGNATAATGQVSGVRGVANSTTTGAAGLSGGEGAATGVVFGVVGSTSSTTNGASGVTGGEGATTGIVYGVSGNTSSATQGAAGVNGFEGAVSGAVFGVTGGTISKTTGAAGVAGNEGATTGQVFGVSGSTSSTTNQAAGVSGIEGAASGEVFGVVGGTNSSTNGAAGVSGYDNATTGDVFGVVGTTASTSGTGVLGVNSATTGPAIGVFGQTASTGGNGVVGNATAKSGIAIGVLGQTTSPAGAGAAFTNLSGGTSAVIVANGAGSVQIFSVDASGNGSFSGNLNVKGKLTKGSGSFKIDHPLDPANKYLSHSFVESPDMMNVYNGNITTDRHGLATITLPDYFEALNQGFRYQLTVIGQFAQAIVANKIAANRFVIRTSKPNVEVSWQVTGIRQDAYAKAYRIQVEEEKPPQEQGHYLHPELFGAPPERAVGYHALPIPTQDESTHVSSLTAPPTPLQ